MSKLVNAFDTVIINPLLALIFAAGALVFVFGVAEFLFNFNVRGDSHAKETGQKHMIYGIVGMVVMASALTIISIIQSTINSFSH